MQILRVRTGRAVPFEIGGRTLMTAIAKTVVDGPVAVGRLGLAGDEQADPSVHGGLAKAVYAYPSEHLPFWRTVRAQARVAEWDAPLPEGLPGENLLLQGLLERDLWIGDRLVVRGGREDGREGGCVLAVSEPRQPCLKFAAAMGFAQAVRLMRESGLCGAYLAVQEIGTVCAGDEVMLLPGPREVGLAELFRARSRG